MQHSRQRQFTIGTRGSPLALYQARLVQSRLAASLGRPKTDFPIRIFKTSGDKIKGDLKAFGGKGLFTKELEVALMKSEIDLAVHSMKDVPTQGQEDLMITAILERADVRDAFISPRIKTLGALPKGAVVGTASIRRRAQLLSRRPDVQFILIRGNVGTRLDKLARGECDATFLACAGLERLGEADKITEAISTDVMLPAPAQGAIGVEVRLEDREMQDVLAPLDHLATHFAVSVERGFLRALDGSCRTPIAALATYTDGQLDFRGEVLSKDGTLKFSRALVRDCATREDAVSIGYRIGEDIRAEIGDRVLWDEDAP